MAQQPTAAAATGPQAAVSPRPAGETTDSEAKIKAQKEELRKKLTTEQYSVTCEAATEPAFQNAYWNKHEPGIYVDVISGKPLFSSLDKFDSGTGWPSFTKPLVKDAVVECTDSTLGMERTEVRAKDSGSLLGRVFDDGPAEAGGKRFCMNSASLKFIPVAQLKEAGYGQFLPLFEKTGKDAKK